MMSKQIRSQERKLRSSWIVEMAKDLKTAYGLNINSEIEKLLAKEVIKESRKNKINRIFNDN
jgi:hypothetical protein